MTLVSSMIRWWQMFPMIGKAISSLRSPPPSLAQQLSEHDSVASPATYQDLLPKRTRVNFGPTTQRERLLIARRFTSHIRLPSLNTKDSLGVHVTVTAGQILVCPVNSVHQMPIQVPKRGTQCAQLTSSECWLLAVWPCPRIPNWNMDILTILVQLHL
ncbi:hypothetical protein BJX99DRAFT_223439 [Aspergillus californicus]